MSRSSRARWRWALAAVVILAVGRPAALLAQEERLAGLPIVEIEFQGLETLPAETLRYYLGVEEGAAYDPQRLNENLHQLWERQLLDDIQIDAVPAGRGVRLQVTVEERPVLKSIVYEGLEKVSRTEIADRMATERVQVVEGAPLELGEIERLRGTIEEMYREKGFRLARAQYRVETPAPGERRVVFTIDEGDKIRIADIDLQNNTVFRDWRLQLAMKETKESDFFSRIRKRDIYNPATVTEDLQRVAEFYRDHGYKNADVGEPEVEIRPEDPYALPGEGNERQLHLTIPVEEGGRWTLGEVSIQGNEKYKEEQLMRLFERPRGNWLRAGQIQESVDSILEVYNNTGFIQAQVQPEMVEREGRVADLFIHVHEGDQYRVGRMEFDGNTRTRDKVLRREMLIQEGRLVNTGALRNSLRRIGQLQYWKVDEEEPVSLEVNNEEKTVDITVHGQEGDRTELQFGAGWSEVEGFFGQFLLRSRNFLGRGETVGASYSSGRFSDSFNLSYQAPWFLDRPQSFGIQVYQQELDYTQFFGQEFVQERRGGTVSYGRNLGIFGSMVLTGTYYTADEVQTLFNSVTNEQVRFEIDRTFASLRPAYILDSRDNPLFPSRGVRLNAGVEYVGGVLGGSSSFVRPEVAFSFWVPVTEEGVETIFGAQVRGGLIDPFEDTPLFFSDRYFLGGEQTVRGFRFRTIWVRDENDQTLFDENGFVLGGEKMFQANAEYHFAFGDSFRLLAFVDAGNVYGADQDWDLGRLRASAGIEFRVFVPVFGAPLRFIYADNLNPLPDDRFDTFQFSIGTTF